MMDVFYWGYFHLVCIASLGLSGVALYRTLPRNDAGGRVPVKHRRKGR